MDWQVFGRLSYADESSSKGTRATVGWRLAVTIVAVFVVPASPVGAATIIQGTIQPSRHEITTSPDYLYGLGNDVIYLDVVNIPDPSGATMHWVWIQNHGTQYVVDYGLDRGSTVPAVLHSPNDTGNDGITSDHIFITGAAEVTEKYRYRFDTDEPPEELASLNEFLEGSTVYVGLSPYEGDFDPTLQQVLDATNGLVIVGQYPPDGVDIADDEWVLFASGTVPEPASALLAVLAFAGAAVLRRRPLSPPTRGG